MKNRDETIELRHQSVVINGFFSPFFSFFFSQREKKLPYSEFVKYGKCVFPKISTGNLVKVKLKAIKLKIVILQNKNREGTC